MRSENRRPSHRRNNPDWVYRRNRDRTSWWPLEIQVILRRLQAIHIRIRGAG